MNNTGRNTRIQFIFRGIFINVNHHITVVVCHNFIIHYLDIIEICYFYCSFNREPFIFLPILDRGTLRHVLVEPVLGLCKGLVGGRVYVPILTAGYLPIRS